MFSKFKQIPLLFPMNINSLINICCFRHDSPFSGIPWQLFPTGIAATAATNCLRCIPSLRRSTPQYGNILLYKLTDAVRALVAYYCAISHIYIGRVFLYLAVAAMILYAIPRVPGY